LNYNFKHLFRDWFYTIFFIALFLFSCSSDITKSKLENPILKTHFTFHQDVDKLYFGLETTESFNDQQLTSVYVMWYGINQKNLPDTLILSDNGEKGDIIKDDNIYALKIDNNFATIQNTIGDDSGSVYIDYNVSYDDSIISQVDSFQIGNLIPKILSIIFPDSMLHPTEENYYAIDSIFISVFDPNGLNDIRSCYLMFQKPDGSYSNNGEPIYLFDDGNKSDDNISIWDLTANDGIFSRLITIGNENPLGKYYATFYLNDWAGLFTFRSDSLVVYE
tara:strand:+ start:27 stop:857 length:831 start_codon:yes stop_codon:yes gene_type:complete